MKKQNSKCPLCDYVLEKEDLGKDYCPYCGESVNPKKEDK